MNVYNIWHHTMPATPADPKSYHSYVLYISYYLLYTSYVLYTYILYTYICIIHASYALFIIQLIRRFIICYLSVARSGILSVTQAMVMGGHVRRLTENVSLIIFDKQSQ